ncbi:MAG TPA: ABC transporter substrate-binding protein [Solirubrobacterales bacterium]|nr:ABC transporter substrate-binding protein [Solirubrobacterales bacterium]
MRIASLVPSATEALFALGAGAEVVAVTHECDHPAEALRLPRLTRSVIPPGLEPAEVDARVREVTGRGDALYELDEPALARLAPDLIVTQALCAVCAVSYEDVRAVAARLESCPDVISLDPKTLGEVLDDLVRLGVAIGDPAAGERLRARLERRLERVRAAVVGAPRPRVAALEWLDPPYAGGHWVPEMIDLAGGTSAAGEAGRDSRALSWDELAANGPEVAVVMPCGLYAEEAAKQALARGDAIARLGAERVVAVDAASSFSRPGPRLVDGVELLAHVLHPARARAPAGLAFRDLTEELGRASTAPSSPSR